MLMQVKLILCFTQLIYISNSVFGKYNEGSIVLESEKLTFKPVLLKSGSVAFAAYNDTISSNGWGVLDLTAESNGDKYSAKQVMYSAGMLEGIITADRIAQNYENLLDFAFESDKVKKKVCKFLAQQETWLRQKIKEDGGKTAFWIEAANVQYQLDGLIDGFNMVKKTTGRCPLQVLSAIGELIDLKYVLDPNLFPDVDSMTSSQLGTFMRTNGHCSAIVKITPGFEDIFMGHSSWFIYSAMLRIYKNYNLQPSKQYNPKGKMSFSSYPGFLVSLDDFYMLGSKMVMLQTTNNIFNKTLYDLVVPQSLFAWQRVRISHKLANSGAEWGALFSQYNSGTYNNQYMIIDLKKFTPGFDLKDGALYVVEQIPGYVEYADQTDILRAGYWPSFNIPFYEKIFNMSGYARLALRNTDYTHALAPRAKIFRRDQSTVTSIQGIQDILRSNNYKNDAYSKGDPCKTICCRGDLSSTDPRTDGCYDTKVTNYKMALEFKSNAVSGPSRGFKDSLQPFSWIRFKNTSHSGMPEVFNFGFVDMKPKFN